MMIVCPATDMKPTRSEPLVLGSAAARMMPEPATLDQSTRSQSWFDVAFQEQALPPVTLMAVLPPRAGRFALVLERLTEQRWPACVKVTAWALIVRVPLRSPAAEFFCTA